MSVSFSISNPMRNPRLGKIISIMFITIGAILIEPNLHFSQIQTSSSRTIINFTENSFLGLFLILIGILHLLRIYSVSFKNIFGKKKCLICKIETQDILIKDGDTHIPYCRTHLMQTFSKLFLPFPYPVIIFQPEQERKYCGTMFPYYPISDFESFNFSKEDELAMQKILRGIDGKCSACKENATVAYFRKGILQWDGGGPMMRNVTVSGEHLCKECTLERIEPDLRMNKNPFTDNGLFVPYKGEGVFVNTYL